MVTLLDLTRESRPAGNGAAFTKSSDGDTRSVARPTEAALLARRHEYGVYVLAERADGRVCGQVFTSLPAAERKVSRARERGLAATMTLVRLVPTTVALPEVAHLLDGEGGGSR